MRRSLITVLLLSLLIAPARGQSGPQLTQSTVAGGGGVSTQGSLRVEGTIGQTSAGASSGGTFTLYGGFFAPGQGPSVMSVVRASANPATQNSSVGYLVTFNEPVTGVDATDFQLTTTGLTGASVMGVTGAGAAYNVTVDTGTPASAGATLRLDVLDDDTIVNAGGDTLGGAGAVNGNFTSGEVYAVDRIIARVNDSKVSEPSAGTTPLLFTVTLSAPAPSVGVSVGYATASGATAPATGGASCGGAVDYLTTSGTLTFSAGERVKTVSVGVCADVDSVETDETLLLNLTNPTLGTLADAQAAGVITQGTTAGTFVISELRTSGPAGQTDDFIELYNNTDSPLTVTASDASAGYGVYARGADCNATPVLVATIPNGRVIPARGHYLIVGAAYSLADYGGTGAAVGDTTFTSDLGSDASVAIFTTADVNAVSTATRLDAVGFGTGNTGAVCDLLREGNNLAAVSASTTEHSFFRKQCDFVAVVGCTTPGNPKDVGDNAADFLFADTQATDMPGVGQRLGAPGPENLASPIRRGEGGALTLLLLDQTKSSSAPINRARNSTPDPATNSTFGTLSIRRRVVNNTGGKVTRLRFRITELTTLPSPGGGQADVRAITSTSVQVSGVEDTGTCSAASLSPSCMVTVQGTTLEQQPAQPKGGGYNSTLAVGTVTLDTPLANGASINVQFLLGVQAAGTFRFYVIMEALP
ncbi:MAG TPA: hypothetical protein VM934_11995 [Pyrinomonadaceae bacterium]|jgi:hypothetical protein|nr:hypothetical protein [Pyrinomonadaceae bacterium]